MKADKPESGEQSDPASADGVGRLTLGERQCLELVASGMVSKEIARILDISPHTVDARLRTATRKLNARNRFAAAQMLIDIQKDCGEADRDLLSTASEISFAPSEDGPSSRTPCAPAALLSKVLAEDADLSVGRRLLLIVAMLVGTAALFTAVAAALLRFSDWLSAIS